MIALARAHREQRQTHDSRAALYGVKALFDTLDTQPSTNRKHLAILCAKAWWLHSELCLSEGNLQQAMAAVRTAASIINSVWAQLEQRSTKKLPATEDDAGTDHLTSKVSKLNFTDTSKEDVRASSRGPSFWIIIPVASSIIMHAADVYTHAGLFVEAHHYATKAVAIADSIEGSMWSIAARSKLASILTLADRVEDAELCLAKLDVAPVEPRMPVVDLYRVRARLCASTGELEQSLKHYDAACDVLVQIGARFNAFGEPMCAKSLEIAVAAPKPKSAAAVRSRSTVRTKASQHVKASRLSPAIERVLYDIKLERAHIEQRLHGNFDALEPLHEMVNSSLRQLQHLQAMSSFETKAQTDVVFNALVESSLICPGVSGSTASTIVEDTQPQRKAATKTKSSITRGKTPKAALTNIMPKSELGRLLRDARGHLQLPTASCRSIEAMTDIHRESQMLVTSSIYSSATNLEVNNRLGALDIASSISMPASLAKMRERFALKVDLSSTPKSAQLPWPCVMPTEQDDETVAAVEISDILPDSWTVVSLQLSADATELLVMRQHKDDACFIVRLPFARQDIEAERADSFDFAAGKAELAEIIEQSNSICHAGNEPSKKMASAAWWREREQLDKRLHELLVNIEEIWLGGFKGVLCPTECHKNLAAFRKQFETILARHIPWAKKEPKLALPDTTLQLFLSLCHGQGASLEIDEPVLDLLYSVVDSLKFHGRELAFDEIDFDTLTIELIDALQMHHDGIDKDAETEEHLILVLDKRLQNFPWESLPYLENTSVSRMGDMLSLRDRILSMRSSDLDGRYLVSHELGTVILDPAADMKRTQETMQPALQNVMSTRPAWQSIVGRSPTEAEFEEALSSSSIVMYFGHGAGSQYIRPRTVKKMANCSEVVWLMGCSSGAVTEHGELEATSVPASYLVAGGCNIVSSECRKCLAVVANLWDVTDKDIDRFSIAAGADWGLWSPPEDGKHSPVAVAIRGAVRDTTSTPPVVLMTPKASRAPRGEVSSKTPARKRSRKADARLLSLSEAVSRNRDACYLRYLNGAAPVVYGVPVYLDKR
ncbi:hypothetical protein AMS68_003750 [Peltaster fructicola]|uniref:separase n=1 Tax=Peltaster fructicola TaxID=286661 RepID=A0A6H0XU32_9PEZI|nr:hypothetical protein AMS68_003750 [Peltaster fructicola]